MTSLTKTAPPSQQIFFQVQTTRLATSFDTSTRSVTRTGAEIFPRKTTYDPVVYGYGNFAILIQSETLSSTPYPIHIRKYKIMDCDIQPKSEIAQSIAH